METTPLQSPSLSFSILIRTLGLRQHSGPQTSHLREGCDWAFILEGEEGAALLKGASPGTGVASSGEGVGLPGLLWVVENMQMYTLF